MRIVAGEFRGRIIDAPEGEGTRPTTDRVREALFSSLYSLRGGFDGAVVLDAFAGSGALGIEALSRGAERAVFFENAQRAAKACQRNLGVCKLDASRAVIMRRDFLRNPPITQIPPFDLVFLDPPYAFDPQNVLQVIRTLVDSEAISRDAIVVYEHAHTAAREVAEAAQAAGFELAASKKYGKTGVAILKME